MRLQLVIANQLTCNLDTNEEVAALGKLWSHLASTKLQLHRVDDHRMLTIEKHGFVNPHVKRTRFPFIITVSVN